MHLVEHHEFDINLTSVERMLRRTPLVAAGEYRCPVEHPQFAGGGPQKCPFIVFSRTSVRLIPSRGRPEVCTPNTINLWDVGDSYSRKPLSKEGVICDWIAVAPSLLREMGEYVNSALHDKPQEVFSRSVAPITSRTFLAQRIFFRSLQRDSTIPSLAIEEYVILLLERVIRETLGFTHKLQWSRAESDRSSAIRRHEMIEETKCILAREFCSQVSVSELAERVHCSPGYLSRSFRNQTGFTLHAYQEQLRLRASLQLISDAAFNGAGIAAQLGFANHSHFSDVFRTHFGITPTNFAKTCSSAALEGLHCMLDDLNRIAAQQEKCRSG